MIEVHHLTKRYGRTIAVHDLSFEVRPGVVTGFLGPNGAGKSTTLRVVLGLERPTAGQARVAGRWYGELARPLTTVGAMLDARAVHPGRSARDHLAVLARSNRLAASRVDEVLGQTGLSAVGHRRAGGFSLGMYQRLGIAAALLGDPAVVVLDEPLNGLDTEGIRWLRGLLRTLAAEGRTVLLSSHVMGEVELVADDVVVIGRGRLLAAEPTATFVASRSPRVIVVRTPSPERLRPALDRLGATTVPDAAGAWRVTGVDAATIGDVACREDVPLHELRPVHTSLEDVYSQLTGARVEYRTTERVAS